MSKGPPVPMELLYLSLKELIKSCIGSLDELAPCLDD